MLVADTWHSDEMPGLRRVLCGFHSCGGVLGNTLTAVISMNGTGSPGNPSEEKSACIYTAAFYRSGLLCQHAICLQLASVLKLTSRAR